MALIRLDHLTKRYGPVTAIDDLTVALQPGRITGFLGTNGAGKSTTLRMLVGLTRPTAGSATIDGRPYAALEQPARTIGTVIDTGAFHPRRSGRDALRVLATLSGISDRRVDHLLELVGLHEAGRRRVGGYSTGMRQRLGLAAALLADPDTLILDEPANGLDPAGVHWLRTLLRSLADQGRTVLVSSHLLAELQHTVDDVILIDHGRLITHGPMSELLARSKAHTLEELFFDLIPTGARP
jgi:ABC-2 type transport system ATP-binding protein